LKQKHGGRNHKNKKEYVGRNFMLAFTQKRQARYTSKREKKKSKLEEKGDHFTAL
jgi:hypothetical protein